MPLPNIPISTVPAEGDAAFPAMQPIQVLDPVGPQAANRQPNDLRTRDATLRDRVNLLIDNMNTITQGGGGADFYLPRDGSQAMTAILNMGSNRIINVTDPTDAQDAATKNYVDTNVAVNTVRTVPRVEFQALDDASGGGIQSAIANYDFEPVEWPSGLPPYLKIILGTYGVNNIVPAFPNPVGSWLIEVWPFLNLNGPSLFQWQSRVQLYAGAPSVNPTAGTAVQNTDRVKGGNETYWHQSGNEVLGTGGQLTVAQFTDNVEVRLNWTHDVPVVDTNRLTVTLRSNNTACWLDMIMVAQPLRNI